MLANLLDGSLDLQEVLRRQFFGISSVCQQQHGVASAHMSVDTDAVKCAVHSKPKRLITLFRGQCGIRQDNSQHRRHVWRDHGSAFAGTGDSYGAAGDPDVDRCELRKGVRGHH